jgi:hypothetical protein
MEDIMADNQKRPGKVNIRMDLPPATVEVLSRHGLKIEVRRLENQTKVMLDQGSGMAEGDGCISNPGGPSC